MRYQISQINMEKQMDKAMPKGNIITVNFKETKEVIDFTIAFGRGVVASMEDGKFTVEDIINFLPAAMRIGSALQGINGVVVEFKIGTDEEYKSLVEYVAMEVELENKAAEKFIEDSFAMAISIWNYVRTHFYKTVKIEEVELPKPNLTDVAQDIVDKKVANEVVESAKADVIAPGQPESNENVKVETSNENNADINAGVEG